MLAIGKAHRINLINMSSLDSCTNFVLCQIVAHNFTIFWATDDLFAVAWKLTRENPPTSPLSLKSVTLVSGPSEVKNFLLTFQSSQVDQTNISIYTWIDQKLLIDVYIHIGDSPTNLIARYLRNQTEVLRVRGVV